MESTRKPPSRRLITDIKRAAKAAARAGAEQHTAALERLARDAGYPSWDALQRACGDLAEQTTPGGLPLDPRLPADFDDTPNEVP